MQRIGVTIAGASPLHLHYHIGPGVGADPEDAARNRCSPVGTIRGSALEYALGRAAFALGGGELRLATYIVAKVDDEHIPIRSHGLMVSAAIRDDRELLYVGLTFVDWRLDFTLDLLGRSTVAYVRNLLEFAGGRIGLGYQPPNVRTRFGTFGLTRWERLENEKPLRTRRQHQTS